VGFILIIHLKTLDLAWVGIAGITMGLSFEDTRLIIVSYLALAITNDDEKS